MCVFIYIICILSKKCSSVMQAGNALDALHECEDLKKEGLCEHNVLVACFYIEQTFFYNRRCFTFSFNYLFLFSKDIFN